MHSPLSRTLRWAAIITGTLVLAFLLFMLIGHLTGDANGPNGMVFSTPAEVVAFVLFPVCTIVGLALAYRWELPGGLIALLSLAALCVLRPDLLQWPFAAIATPGILYLVHWVLTRGSRKAAQA